MQGSAIRYLTKIDVRYYTYAVLVKISTEIRSMDAAATAAAGDIEMVEEGSEEGEEEMEGLGGVSGGNKRRSAAGPSLFISSTLNLNPFVPQFPGSTKIIPLHNPMMLELSRSRS